MLAMEEILGHSGVNTVLDLAHLSVNIDQSSASSHDIKFPPEHVGRLQAALDSVYGPRGGRGLSIRVGRACVKYGLREFGPELGMTDLSFRLLPLPTRLRVGVEAIAGLFNQLSDRLVNLEVDEKHINWHIARCPLCRERQTDGPCCTLAVGLLQEALYWISGGKYFLVEEKECIACDGGTCTIMISKTPLS